MYLFNVLPNFLGDRGPASIGTALFVREDHSRKCTATLITVTPLQIWTAICLCHQVRACHTGLKALVNVLLQLWSGLPRL